MRAATCTPWKRLHFSSSEFVSTCGRDGELRVRPHAGKFAFAVVHKGHIVRQGTATSARKAKTAARRQAGATSGLAGLGMWPFSKKKAKQLPRDPRRMAQTVMYIPSPSGRVNQVMRGAQESYAAYKRRMKRIAAKARRTPGFAPYRAAPYERD